MSEKESQRKVRVRIITWVGLIIFSMTCLVFAYIQRMEAQHLKELSIRCHEELLRVEKVAAQTKDAAYQQQKMAIEYAHKANQALEDCKNRK